MMQAVATRAARNHPAVILTGARQVGKTRLVRRVFPDREYVSLELPSEAEQAEHDPRGFLARHSPPLVIDEVQHAPTLFRHIRRSIDQTNRRPGQFVLAGGRIPEDARCLAGCSVMLVLEGLSWAEITTARLPYAVEDVLVRGTFPELYEKPEIDASLFLRSYVSTYLERDLRQLLQVSSLRDYERFLRACALRTGQLLNKAQLAREVDIVGSTAAIWLSMLEATNQVALLEPWPSSPTKTLVKTPKLYLCDVGLASFLCGITDTSALAASPFRGALWETFVFSEIRRALAQAGTPQEVHFWRDRTKEADFFFRRDGLVHLADAKWNELPQHRDFASLSRIAAELPETVRSQTLFCRTSNRLPLSSSTAVLPLADMEGYVKNI